MIEKIIEEYPEDSFLKADGFDDAIIGIDWNNMRLIYSVKKCIDIIAKDMSEEDAIEYFEYNVGSAYVGKKTPIWCWDNFS